MRNLKLLGSRVRSFLIPAILVIMLLIGARIFVSTSAWYARIDTPSRWNKSSDELYEDTRYAALYKLLLRARTDCQAKQPVYVLSSDQTTIASKDSQIWAAIFLGNYVLYPNRVIEAATSRQAPPTNTCFFTYQLAPNTTNAEYQTLQSHWLDRPKRELLCTEEGCLYQLN